VIAELAARGVLDDRRFAEDYVNWHARRGQGPIRIAAQLRRCGLPEELVDAALASGRIGTRSRAARAPPSSAASRRRAGPTRHGRPVFCGIVAFPSDHIGAATGADPDVD